MSFFHLNVSFSHPTPSSPLPVAARSINSARNGILVLHGRGPNSFHRFCGLKLWLLKSLNLSPRSRKHQPFNEFGTVINRETDQSQYHPEKFSSREDQFTKRGSPTSPLSPSQPVKHATATDGNEDSRESTTQTILLDSVQTQSLNAQGEGSRRASLCIAVIGATGELARRKIFPALFALYYSGFLPEDVGIFGYSRKNLTDEDLRSAIASTLTCRIDHRENCDDKIDSFLRRIYHITGGYNNREGMSKLNKKMQEIEDTSGANRIFYLSVPHDALLDVASCLADYAQTRTGWNRIIFEKPFGFDPRSSATLTKCLLSKFEEEQIYRIDHLLGRNLIENLTVLRFSNLVFEPLWSRTHVRNVQIILSEDTGVQAGRYSDGYGIIQDIVHTHILQTIALLAMEPPISLSGEDIRNEKVKVLRSIRRLDPSDVILGQYKSSSTDKLEPSLSRMLPTYCAAALYIDNARWDGVPFLIKVGTGLIKHRVEIRIQFRHVPGNLYRDRIGHNINQATNDLILCDEPDEAILVKINNKIPGLSLQLDASELNLLYKDRYKGEVPDSYEHLLVDVTDGDNHLFMRSDEVEAAWNVLTPVLQEIRNNNVVPELYEFGGRGPVGAYYLWAKHGVQWPDD